MSQAVHQRTFLYISSSTSTHGHKHRAHLPAVLVRYSRYWTACWRAQRFEVGTCLLMLCYLHAFCHVVFCLGHHIMYSTTCPWILGRLDGSSEWISCTRTIQLHAVFRCPWRVRTIELSCFSKWLLLCFDSSNHGNKMLSCHHVYGCAWLHHHQRTGLMDVVITWATFPADCVHNLNFFLNLTTRFLSTIVVLKSDAA